MACNLSSGRKVPCKSSVGGLKAIYFADYGTLGGVTKSGSTITDILGTPTWYQFDIQGNSSLESTINSSRENGTTFYTQTLSLTLPFLDAATQDQIKILAHGRPHIIVEDKNGSKFMVGLENGADVTGGTIVTGAALGDLSGYTLTFEAMEKDAPYFVTEVISASGTQIDPTA